MQIASAQLYFRVVVASLLSLLLVSWVDYVTGYELLFYVFYFVPVCMCAWFLDWPTTLAMVIISAISGFFVDRFSGHQYPHEAMRYWNALISFIALGAMGLVLHHLRESQREQRQAQERLAQAFDDLNLKTGEIRKLQSQLQVVCAWTKKIRVDGKWIDMEKFLADKLHISISHGISPEALDELKKSLDQDQPR